LGRFVLKKVLAQFREERGRGTSSKSVSKKEIEDEKGD